MLILCKVKVLSGYSAKNGGLVEVCGPGNGTTISLRFFMGEKNDSQEEVCEEETLHSDMVIVGGPDMDPHVLRDETYVLDNIPAARTYRTAHGSHWIASNVKEYDFVLYLDDDSFVDLKRLTVLLEGVLRENEDQAKLLSLGYIMETRLDPDGIDICEWCSPCDKCLQDPELTKLCGHFTGLFGLGTCAYFGSKWTPLWLLGMGWVWGRSIVEYIGQNAKYFKMRGSADVMLGYWLVAIEDIHWMDMSPNKFHDAPKPADKSTFAAYCTDETILVHRMIEALWDKVNEDTCHLECFDDDSPDPPS
eukprot:GEMP01052518.1.p1 GENE.GEMP01052518.1~~GEMP01052518.1.p1  ORF type:complete len:305 (+),score=55.57 GEMP01052518.1:296-1210(+)